MLKRKIILSFTIMISVAVTFAACSSPIYQAEIGSTVPQVPEDSARYLILARALDLEAVDSYPQTITRLNSDQSLYSLEIEIKLDRDRVITVPLDDYDYPPEVALYLEPTALIQSDSPEVCELAQRLYIGQDIAGYAQTVAAWTAKNILFDNNLAQKIWNGQVDTQSALDTLQRKQGTCSEYANLFIALMRCQGIPARFVHGFVHGGMYHAWAEFYLEGAGWIPVETQMGQVGVSTRHIKLFAGQDFAQIGVKLKEIQIKVVPVSLPSRPENSFSGCRAQTTEAGFKPLATNRLSAGLDSPQAQILICAGRVYDLII
jgi:hypothetical protein